MTPSLPPAQNAASERRRSSPATERLAANCLMRRPIRLLRAALQLRSAYGGGNGLSKTGGQHAGGASGCTIANVAIPEAQ
jgi:hypothetical protein